MTLEEKLTQEFQSDSYQALTDPLKTDKGISDVGTKYLRIQEIYQQYKDEAEGKFRMEWGLFKHVDDKNRNLSIDISKQDTNKKAITNPNRNDKSLIETLQILRNF